MAILPKKINRFIHIEVTVRGGEPSSYFIVLHDSTALINKVGKFN
jgi:hypothetical protein